MRIAVGSDHAGFPLKERVKAHLASQGYEAVDCGASSDARSDYPDFAQEVARRVSRGAAERGILVCGSGIGMCMAANRFPGVRAAVIREPGDAEMSRRHNDANVACLGARVTDEELALTLVDLFLSTPFEGGRHEARIKKIDKETP